MIPRGVDRIILEYCKYKPKFMDEIRDKYFKACYSDVIMSIRFASNDYNDYSLYPISIFRKKLLKPYIKSSMWRCCRCSSCDLLMDVDDIIDFVGVVDEDSSYGYCKRCISRFY